LAEALEKYLDEVVIHQKAAEKTEACIRIMFPLIEDLYVNQIQEAAKLIRDAKRLPRRNDGKFRDGIEGAPLAKGTINRRLAILRRIANLAHEDWHWIDRPIKITLLPDASARDEYLTLKEIYQLSAACKPPANHWVITAAFMGLRQGEMLRLTQNNIRGDMLYLDNTKNGRALLLPIPPKVRNALETWIAAPKPHRRTLYKYFKQAAKEINRPDLRPHDLRHTTASLIINAGFGLEIVAEVLNCTIQNAQRYAHLEDERKKKALLAITEEQ
jgi:integrase